MRQKLDEILKKKLQGGDPYIGFSGWEKLEKELYLADKEEERKRKPPFSLLFLRYAAVIVLLIGLGTGGVLFFKGRQPEKLVDGAGLNQNQRNLEDAEKKGDEENEVDVPQLTVQGSPSQLTESDLSYKLDLIGINNAPEFHTDEPFNSDGSLFDDIFLKRSENQGNISLVSTPILISSLINNQVGLAKQYEEMYDIDQYLNEFNNIYGQPEDTTDLISALFSFDILSINSGGGESFSVIQDPDKSKFAQFISSLDIYKYKSIEVKSDALIINPQIVISDEVYSYLNNSLVHKFPISLEAAINKKINGKVGIGTGLSYTFLESFAGSKKQDKPNYTQKIHYLGLPITMQYTVISGHSALSIDAKLALVAEKAISAKGILFVPQNNGHEVYSIFLNTPSELMLSTNFGLELGYKVADKVSLFAEPVVGYYFFVDGQPISYKTDRRVNLSFKIGSKFVF